MQIPPILVVIASAAKEARTQHMPQVDGLIGRDLAEQKHTLDRHRRDQVVEDIVLLFIRLVFAQIARVATAFLVARVIISAATLIVRRVTALSADRIAIDFFLVGALHLLGSGFLRLVEVDRAVRYRSSRNQLDQLTQRTIHGDLHTEAGKLSTATTSCIFFQNRLYYLKEFS